MNIRPPPIKTTNIVKTIQFKERNLLYPPDIQDIVHCIAFLAVWRLALRNSASAHIAITSSGLCKDIQLIASIVGEISDDVVLMPQPIYRTNIQSQCNNKIVRST